jgi:hypothetical protein
VYRDGVKEEGAGVTVFTEVVGEKPEELELE